MKTYRDYNSPIIGNTILRPMLTYLLDNTEVVTLVIEEYDQVKYKHDLYGLLYDQNVDNTSWSATLLVNGWTSPTEYQGESTILLVSPRYTEAITKALTAISYN